MQRRLGVAAQVLRERSQRELGGGGLREHAGVRKTAEQALERTLVGAGRGGEPPDGPRPVRERVGDPEHRGDRDALREHVAAEHSEEDVARAGRGRRGCGSFTRRRTRRQRTELSRRMGRRAIVTVCHGGKPQLTLLGRGPNVEMSDAEKEVHMSGQIGHAFDLDLQVGGELDLFAEELPEQLQLMSDCASSASSASCVGSCWASFSTMGSIISCSW